MENRLEDNTIEDDTIEDDTTKTCERNPHGMQLGSSEPPKISPCSCRSQLSLATSSWLVRHNSGVSLAKAYVYLLS